MLSKLAGIPSPSEDEVNPMQHIKDDEHVSPLELEAISVQKSNIGHSVGVGNNFASHRHITKENAGLYITLVVVIGLLLLAIFVALLYAIVQHLRKKYFKKEIMGNETSAVSDEDYQGLLQGDQTMYFFGPTVRQDNKSLLDYKELCRQRYATKNAEKEFAPDQHNAINGKDSFVTKQFQTQKSLIQNSTPSSTVSTPAPPYMHDNLTRHSSIASLSWSEEPITATLDISTGHAILSYMEDHLKNKEKLDEEWAGICAYEADDVTMKAAMLPKNVRKNRSPDALPFDQNRVKLDSSTNHLGSDYINASLIGPLSSTIPDFWQTVWEKGCAAIVMLAPLVEESVPQCARYWPDEGSCSYDRFEIHLVSEHIWCEDYLVRSLYLKNTSKGETRTVTQFHFLSWPNDGIPQNTKALLELRRKVTKCYKGQSSPVLVHCNDGVGRTGTYILLDLAINRMLKGAKEIDIAATLEHIRDQRQGVVRSKDQFEFALTAVADEVNAILKSLTLTQ